MPLKQQTRRRIDFSTSVKGGRVSPTEADLAVERAIEAEEKKGTHDPRIETMYARDKWTIYVFVAAMLVVLWGVFFYVALPQIDDPALLWFLVALGAFASLFNTVGMITNTRRLWNERIRFYSQDLFWQDQKKALKAEATQFKAAQRSGP
jgi:hypothetical protein